MNYNIKTVPVSAYEAVPDTARRYVDGLKHGSTEMMKNKKEPLCL